MDISEEDAADLVPCISAGWHQRSQRHSQDKCPVVRRFERSDIAEALVSLLEHRLLTIKDDANFIIRSVEAETDLSRLAVEDSTGATHRVTLVVGMP